ncbi:hypothetical protein E2C01_033009 [Portunus trituberculatus]|uniref:RNA-directed DNA polymerase from mobile element jockey n=1 Tax=Portunus trituberculatus TaxID=210409 RepID=A0A5B7EXF5_PORTR|nr:hypothetical protein [Portunus trituberculatus]
MEQKLVTAFHVAADASIPLTKRPKHQYRDRPRVPLSVHNTEIEWTLGHQYLGVWLDHHLTFQQHICHTTDRICPRLRIMRAMTGTEGGADLRVLKMYYFQAIRSIVDYAAPVLATTQPSLIEKLEKQQNFALRLMLGAPQWAKLCNLRAEAKITQLSHRIKNISLNLLAEKAIHPRHTTIVCRVFQSLAQDERLFQKKTWARKTAHNIQAIKAVAAFKRLRQDPPHPDYSRAAPWESSPIKISVSPLTDKKSSLPNAELARQARNSLAAGRINGADTYYTDVSVDPISHRAAAAFHHHEATGSTAADGSPSANWYLAVTDNTPFPLPNTLPRYITTRLHRLRLGYHCLAELNHTLPIDCTHCQTPTNTPLLHYISDCERTARFLVRDPTTPITLKLTPMDQLVEMVRKYPPPR